MKFNSKYFLEIKSEIDGEKLKRAGSKTSKTSKDDLISHKKEGTVKRKLKFLIGNL